jgi:hypothetical protein
MKQIDLQDLPPMFAKAEKALREATAAAIAEHWRAGHPIYVWREERVVALFPDGTSVPLEKGQYKLDPQQYK